MNYESSVTADSPEYTTADMAGADGRTERSSRRGLWITVVLLAIVVVAVAVYYLMGSGEPAPEAGADAGQAPAITVVSPGSGSIEGEISATGTLAARRAMPVGIAGEGGRVVSVPVDAGQWVNAGQVLAVIDHSVQNQQAASASAQVQVAQADARLAQSNLERALQLVDRGFISQADVDRLTATRDAAAARVKVAQAQAGELRARNARLNVVAPASGLVLERNVEPGQVVGAGAGTLFLIAKGGEMEMLARVGESDLARLSTGVSADVVPVGTEKVYNGQIWQLSPTIDPQNRQGTARIALPYAEGLRPGGFAAATIKSGTVVAPLLPESAVLSDDEGSYVYVAGKDNKVERRAVQTGAVTADGVIITQGLTGRERIVLRAGGFLNPGQTIRPVKAGS
ncbi:efflux RND transporter periplasmic adaptor subunit [Allopontixanthobacter sediminis]|uniref:Efflux RND transporter periplasmic adaptor subunit n=1 Tax=Allopontixanthobacter sediminis TaxID=1689985 RepID=A0A845B250_9SPHN|nr:efflux RND transporter periplasmic adaptor subunit [Allopontixanthobacter sediminis]MXP44378.1 efflux RND transporter periplasmic adaptor subunit [Allopontixanthobacter sediminis]